MSRSYQHKPIICWVSCASEKKDKKEWHSKMRCHVRNEIFKQTRDDEYEILHPHENLVGNPWSMGKDGGRHWVNNVRKQRIIDWHIKRYNRKALTGRESYFLDNHKLKKYRDLRYMKQRKI